MSTLEQAQKNIPADFSPPLTLGEALDSMEQRRRHQAIPPGDGAQAG
jgi:hypothetical protein